MTAEILDGRAMSAEIKAEVRRSVEKHWQAPVTNVVLLRHDPAIKAPPWM